MSTPSNNNFIYVDYFKRLIIIVIIIINLQIIKDKEQWTVA